MPEVGGLRAYGIKEARINGFESGIFEFYIRPVVRA